MIFSAIAAGVGAISTFIGGLGAVGSFLLRTAVGIGLNLLAASMAGKTKAPSFSINGDLQGGGDLPRHFILGKYMTGGSLVWANTWGKDDDTPNAWLTQVILLSDLPSKGLTGVWVDGKKVTYGSGTQIDLGYGIPEFVKNGNNLYIKFYDGSQTVADPALLAKASTTARPYGAARVGKGLTYVIIHARSTKNMFSGFPTFQFEVDGTRLYDPSKDTTVGGSGTQRWATPSTWGGDGDENPAVQVYNLLRGISYNGQWLYGMQSLPASRLPVADWIAKINKARTPITESTGAVPTYRSSGEIDVSVPCINAIEEILTTCQGRISEIGGTYYMFLGAPGTATVSFTDADIISTEEQEFTPFQGIADSINGVSATYPSPKDNWNMKTAPPLLRPDLEARDGNRRLLADIELSFVPYDEQVQRLMKSALEEAMRFRRHTITLPPNFWPYAVPGEIISWTSERNGYIAKLMRIDGATDKGNLDVLVDITEVDPTDYDWNSGEDFQPTTDGLVGIIDVPTQTVIGWAATATAIQDNTGTNRRPAILISWNNSPQALLDVRGIRFEIKNKITGTIEYRGYTNDADAGSIIYSQGLLPNTQYEVRGRYDLTSSRLVSDSGWLSVTTLDIKLSDADVFLPGIIDGLEDFLNDSTLWIRDGVRQSILEQQRLARINIDDAMSAATDRGSLRREVAVTTGTNKAYFLEQIDVATGPNSALARRLFSVEATLPDIGANAKAISSLTAVVTATQTSVSVVAQDLTALTAVVAGKAESTALNALTVRTDVVEVDVLTKARVFRQTATPTAADVKLRDLWLKTDEGNRVYICTAIPAGVPTWTLSEDQRIPDLVTITNTQAGQITSLTSQIAGKADASAVSTLQTQVNTVEATANLKNRVFRQSTAPTTQNARDMWIDTGNGNKVYVANSASPFAWILAEDQRIPATVLAVESAAEAITAISAGQTGGDTATANFRMRVTTGVAGYSSRIAMEARTGGTGTWRSAGWVLDVPASSGSPTRFNITADQFSITNGTDIENPFVFQSGVATLNVANIGTVNSGRLLALNGKMDINLNNGTIEIFS